MTYQDFFNKAKEKGFSKIQIVEEEGIHKYIKVIDGELDSYEDYNVLNYNIKAEKDKKTIKLETNYLDNDIIDILVLKDNSTDTFYEDEYLKERESIPRNKAKDIDISCEIKKIKDLKKLKSEYKEIDKLISCFYEEYKNTRIISSEGVDISTDSHLCSYTVEATTSNNGEVTAFDKRILTTNKKELDFEDITKDVIEKTILQSKREKLETKRYDIVLANNVASSIVYHLIEMLSAAGIRNKVSCLENSINKLKFSKLLTIIEDPTNKEYPGYRLFDDEGTDTYKKTIIDEGKIKTYFYNIKEAKLANKKSTGNGYGSIRTRNMYVVPGKNEDLIKKLKDGIYITDYMGSQGTSINATNGQISIQIFGFIVKDGKLIKGFVPAVLTTTIFELLSNIEEIGSDLVFNNTACGSPSLLIKDISIAS